MPLSGLRVPPPPVFLALFALAALLLMLAGRDVGPLIPWLVAAAISLALSRVVPILGERLAAGIEPDGAAADRGTHPIVRAIVWNGPPMGVVFLRGVTVALLISTVLVAIANAPAMASLQGSAPSGGDIALFFRVFESLAWWSFGALAALSAIKAAKIAWPILNETMPFPLARLLALAITHILLARDGVFDSFLGIPAWFLIPIAMMVIVPPYLARPFRHLASTAESRAAQWLSRLGIALTSGQPPAPVLFPGVWLALSGFEAIDAARYMDFLVSLPLTGSLQDLNGWALALLGPLVALRLASTLWPRMGDILPSPVVYLAVFVAAMILFSEHGFLADTYEYPAAGLMTAFTWALLFMYLARVLNRIAAIETTGRIKQTASTLASLAAAVMVAVGLTLPVLALLSDMPAVNALLLDYVETEEIGQLYQPYFAGIHSIRHLIAVLFFVVALAWNLPRSTVSVPRFQARPMAIALGFGLAGCLAWMLGQGLSTLGYGYTLAGTVVGAGFLTLAATQMASQLSENSNSVFADAIRWLAESRIRAFMPGVSISIYILLLRPLIYDTLALALAYEWLAVLAAAAAGILRLRNRLQTEITAVEIGAIPSVVWAKHVQTFETRPDPRALSASAFEQQYVDDADWSGIWPYMMGLMCREGVSADSIQAVMTPLRRGLESSSRSRRSGTSRRRREEALREALHIADEVLADRDDSPFAATNDQRIDELLAEFIEWGEEPDATAAAIVAAYEKRGARVNHAVEVAFQLVNEIETQPRFLGVPFPWGGGIQNAHEKRERLTAAIREHLSGNRDVLSLPIVLVANSISLHRNQAGALSGSDEIAVIDANQGVEILSESGPTVQVRTAHNLRGYISRAHLVRLPILPADEAVLRTEYATPEPVIEHD